MGHLSLGREGHHIGHTARSQESSIGGDPECLRGIERCQLDSLLQSLSCKSHDIAHGPVESKNAAGQLALIFATAISYFDL